MRIGDNSTVHRRDDDGDVTFRVTVRVDLYSTNRLPSFAQKVDKSFRRLV